ncbi:hypothetical protein I4U23_005331 [Adineta vaga]|nr:hypothetical protein I4U23_005331 [Adineta vaga]
MGEISRFPPNTTILTIIKNVFIEQWNSSFSYDLFYKSCSPTRCTYLIKIRPKFSEVLIKFISMIGGLIIINKKEQQQQQQQQIHLSCFIRIKATVQKLITLLYKILKELNIFNVRDFGNNIDRTTIKHLGIWATRLYLILFIIGLIILAIYNGVQSTRHTKTFEKPGFDKHNELYQKYGDELKCICSSVASPYERFVKTEAKFHQICSSPFTSNEGRSKLTGGSIPTNLLPEKDYRRFLSAHLQFLQGLCQLSSQIVNITVQQFRFSLFTTSELLSETNFHKRLNLTIQQKQSTAPTTFTRLLLLIRNINHGNAIISTYGSNFQYMILHAGYYIPSEPVIYNNNTCSCGLYSNCTSQAMFNKNKSSKETILIEGLKIGCLPSESFRLSTLECFYNQSCINTIQQYMNTINQTNSTTNSLDALVKLNSSRYSVDTTIDEFINNLFIEQWNTTMNYTSYYEQCSPLSCSYTYIEKFNLIYIITILLSIQSGLSIVLRWISPKIIQNIFKIYRYQKNKRNTIHPIRLVETIPTNTNILSSLSNTELTSNDNVPL